MKKFKKSIEISTKNISDVLQVPIVTSLYKTKNFKNPCLEGRSVIYNNVVVGISLLTSANYLFILL